MADAAQLLDALQRYPLLTAAQREELDRALPDAGADAKTVAGGLKQRGWLTAYQLDRLLSGQGKSLVLGQYVVLERLGEGAMGAVYKARHADNGGIVALKVIDKRRHEHADADDRRDGHAGLHGPRKADGRSDQYSLGCTFYHLLTGRLPFQAKNITEKLLKHRTEQPFPVELIRPDVPADVIAVVNRMMAKAPADRYPDVAAVADALAEPATRPDSAASVKPPSSAALTADLPAAESLPGASVLLQDAIERQKPTRPAAGGSWLWVMVGVMAALVVLGVSAVALALAFL